MRNILLFSKRAHSGNMNNLLLEIIELFLHTCKIFFCVVWFLLFTRMLKIIWVYGLHIFYSLRRRESHCSHIIWYFMIIINECMNTVQRKINERDEMENSRLWRREKAAAATQRLFITRLLLKSCASICPNRVLQSHKLYHQLLL